MARRLFELQAARRRNGDVANGAIYVVYSDITGATPADIAASVDGAAISGSVVTTTDIPGLGPGSAQFYGPPSGADTVYLRSATDATLGVQRIEASLDDRVDLIESRIIDARDFVLAADGDDFALAVQRAIDYAEPLVTATGRPPPVLAFPAALKRWSTPIVWKNAPLIGEDLAQSAVYWDGAAGATVVTRQASSGNSYFLMENVYFRKGTAEPATWIDLRGAGAVDKFARMRNFGLGDCTSDAIKLDGWINLHWTDFRIDHCGGYAIRTTPHAGQSFSSFYLDRFTYDHSRTSGNGTGFLMVDDTAGSPAPGVVRLSNARIELNTAWSGNKALVVDKSGPSRGTVVHLVDIAFFCGAGTSNLLYREDAGSPTLTLDSVQLNGTVTLVGGDTPAQYPAPPTRSFYAKAFVCSDYAVLWSAGTNGVGPDIYMSSFGAKYPFRVFFAAEANARWRMTEAGQMEWGPGSTAPDTTLRRSAADLLLTDDSFQVTRGLREGLLVHGAIGSAETFDALTASVHTATLDANCAATFTGAAASTTAQMTLILTQDGTGSRLVTWPASVDWPGGAAPVLSTAAGAVDVLTFLTADGGTTWLGFLSGKALA